MNLQKIHGVLRFSSHTAAMMCECHVLRAVCGHMRRTSRISQGAEACLRLARDLGCRRHQCRGVGGGLRRHVLEGRRMRRSARLQPAQQLLQVDVHLQQIPSFYYGILGSSMP